MAFVFLYVTASSITEAEAISTSLLRKRLVACTNYFPIQSSYLWKGKIQNSKEVAMIVKTMKEKASIVKKEIERIHSYDIPCVTLLDIKPNEKYGKWLRERIG